MKIDSLRGVTRALLFLFGLAIVPLSGGAAYAQFHGFPSPAPGHNLQVAGVATSASTLNFSTGISGSLSAGTLTLTASSGVTVDSPLAGAGTSGSHLTCSLCLFTGAAINISDTVGGLAPIFAVKNNGGSVSYLDVRATQGVLIKSATGTGSLFCNETTGCGIQYGSGSFYCDGLNCGNPGSGHKIYSDGVLVQGALYTTNVLISVTAPTITSGFGTGASVTANNGTAAFRVGVGTSSGSSGVIGLPTATTGWNCWCNDLTTTTTTVSTCKQTASTTASATIANYSNIDVLGGWANNDVLSVSCFAY